MTPQRIFFISSLPRSGAALLLNILAQNPRFHVSQSSGMLEMLLGSRLTVSQSPTFIGMDPNIVRPAFLGYCAGGLEGYYRNATDKPVIIDKNPAWFHYIDWLKGFHPSPKCVVCVRDLRAVIASMEKLFRRNRHRQDPGDSYGKLGMVSVPNRIIHWLNSAPVGIAAFRLVETLQTGAIKDLLVVRFEDLTANPAAMLPKIYEYLGEPPFEHDFEDLHQVTPIEEPLLGFYGEHRIRPKVEAVRPEWNDILGRDIAEAIKANNVPFYRTFYPDAR